MDVSARSLHTKREVVTRLLDAGLCPRTKRYLGTFENHFSTIGLVGMNRACLNAHWLRADPAQEPAQAFTRTCSIHARPFGRHREQYGDLYNLEATPAESTTYRFAKHDKEQFPNIITANENGKPYYTNSSHLPVGFTDDIFSALDVQDELQTLYTSGTVFHAFLGEKLPDWKAAATLVRKIAENDKLPYYTMSPTYSVCKNRLHRRRGVRCPCCHGNRGVLAHHRLLPPGEELERRQVAGFADRVEYDLGRSHLTRDSSRSVTAAARPSGRRART
ncbi:MAG: anaerobic ribonucleoside-triphosphate reductase [Eggerthellaceae bacterium]